MVARALGAPGRREEGVAEPAAWDAVAREAGGPLGFSSTASSTACGRPRVGPAAVTGPQAQGGDGRKVSSVLELDI